MPADAIPTDLRFISDIDWSKPNAMTADGTPCFEIRCKIPFHFNAYGSFEHVERVIDDDGDGILLEPAATGDSGDNDEVDFNQMGGVLLNGVASSTSVDFYGTEMSLRALKLMAMQMMAGGEGGGTGVPYLPQHNHGLSGPTEWHEVIGRTVHAEVVPVEEVRNAYNPAETQFILRVSISLFDELKSRALLKRLGRGEPIGQSIGGWFTSLQIINNEDGDVERVIVQGVDLDHLAVTRAPANPDSDSLLRLRSTLEESIAGFRATRAVIAVEAGQRAVVPVSVAGMVQARYDAGHMTVEDRHILQMIDNQDGTATVWFSIGEPPEDEGRAVHEDKDEESAAARPADDDGETFDTHNQVEAMCSLKVEERDGRLHVSWDVNEPPENLRAAYRSMLGGDHGEKVQRAVETAASNDDATTEVPGDSPGETSINSATENDSPASTAGGGSDTIVSDAPRSAPLDPDSPDTETGVTSEEPAMTPEDLAAMKEAMRSAVTEATEPLIQRLDDLENRDTLEPAPAPEPLVPDVATTAALEAAEARAVKAEEQLANVLSQPIRHGLSSIAPQIPPGPGGQTALDGLVSRAKEDAPGMAVLIERMKDQITSTKPAKIERYVLDQALSQVLCAAELDGLITPPNQRAQWQ